MTERYRRNAPALIVILVLGWLLAKYSMPSLLSAEEVQAISSLELPATNAADFRAKREEDTLTVKFRLHPDDFQRWSEKAAIPELISDKVPAAMLDSENIGWWNPKQTHHPQGASWERRAILYERKTHTVYYLEKLPPSG